jgi:predicted nucleotidyltransferase
MEIKEQTLLIGKIKNEIHNRNGKLFNAYISGSDLYGWRSEDSDVDIRGMYMLNPREFLGLGNYKSKRSIELNSLCPNYDITIFEIRHGVGLAIQGNCNILEEFTAEQLYKDGNFRRLKDLLNSTWGKNGVYNSYRGMAQFNYKKFILQGRNTVKKYLYVYRGLLAGRYAMTTGMIEPNMERLAKYFRISNAKELLKIKREGKENEPLDRLEAGELDVEISEQFEKLDLAYYQSEISERPQEEMVKKVENLLIDMREQGL